jgi:hypothetical protein
MQLTKRDERRFSEALDRLFQIYRLIDLERKEGKHRNYAVDILPKLDALITIMVHFKDLDENQAKIFAHVLELEKENKRLRNIIKSLTKDNSEIENNA